MAPYAYSNIYKSNEHERLWSVNVQFISYVYIQYFIFIWFVLIHKNAARKSANIECLEAALGYMSLSSDQIFLLLFDDASLELFILQTIGLFRKVQAISPWCKIKLRPPYCRKLKREKEKNVVYLLNLFLLLFHCVPTKVSNEFLVELFVFNSLLCLFFCFSFF